MTVNSHSGRVRSNGSAASWARQVEELALGARGGQPDAAEVEVDVEVGVLDPLGRGEAAEHRRHPLAQPGEDPAGA